MGKWKGMYRLDTTRPGNVNKENVTFKSKRRRVIRDLSDIQTMAEKKYNGAPFGTQTARLNCNLQTFMFQNCLSFEI